MAEGKVATRVFELGARFAVERQEGARRRGQQMNRQLVAHVAIIATVLASLGAFLVIRGPVSGSGPTVTLNPVADAFVYSAKPTRNYGTVNYLRADADPPSASYLRFHVTGLTTDVTK